MDPAGPHHATVPTARDRRARLGRLVRTAAAAARIPDPPPPPPPPVEQTWNPLVYLRQQRAARPRWQRLGFLTVISALLALTIGVGETIAAAVGPAGVVAAWPVLEWPGRLAAAAAGVGWAVLLLGWRSAVPVIGLAVFARWFGDTTSADEDGDEDGLVLPPPGEVPARRVPAGPPASPAVPEPAGPPAPDSPLAKTIARWGQIADWAGGGLAGSTLKHVTANPWGWSGSLLLRPGLTVEDAQARRRNLDSALGTRPGSVRLDQDPTRADRVTLRVVERDPLERPIRWRGPQVGSVTQPLPLGPFEDGSAMLLPVAGQCVLIAGIRGSGKSGVLNVLVGELAACPDVVLWGLDLKHGLELGPWAPVFDRIARTLPDAEALLEAADRIRTARGELLAREGAKREWRPTPERPALVVVCDEQGRLRESATAIARLEAIATLSRSLGVWLVSATQYPTVEVLGSSELRSQYTCFVLLRVQRKQHVNVVLGEGAAAAGWNAHEIDPDKPGVCYLHASGATSPKLGRAWQLTDRMVAQVAAHYAPHRPHLDPASAQAASAVPEQHASPSAGPSPSWAPAASPGRSAWPTQAGTTGTVPPPAGDGLDPAVDGDRALAVLIHTLRAAGPAGRTIGELKAATGMSRSWIYLRLRELTDTGEITRVDRGRWRLTSPSASPKGGHRP
jgi:S-DNA-T family DNA segregation ATPase FtsK/SpoIIIE